MVAEFKQVLQGYWQGLHTPPSGYSPVLAKSQSIVKHTVAEEQLIQGLIQGRHSSPNA